MKTSIPLETLQVKFKSRSRAVAENIFTTIRVYSEFRLYYKNKVQDPDIQDAPLFLTDFLSLPLKCVLLVESLPGSFCLLFLRDRLQEMFNSKQMLFKPRSFQLSLPANTLQTAGEGPGWYFGHPRNFGISYIGENMNLKRLPCQNKFQIFLVMTKGGLFCDLISNHERTT